MKKLDEQKMAEEILNPIINEVVYFVLKKIYERREDLEKIGYFSSILTILINLVGNCMWNTTYFSEIPKEGKEEIVDFFCGKMLLFFEERKKDADSKDILNKLDDNIKH